MRAKSGQAREMGARGAQGGRKVSVLLPLLHASSCRFFVRRLLFHGMRWCVSAMATRVPLYSAQLSSRGQLALQRASSYFGAMRLRYVWPVCVVLIRMCGPHVCHPCVPSMFAIHMSIHVCHPSVPSMCAVHLCHPCVSSCSPPLIHIDE